MSYIDSLKKATSLHDIASILGFKPQALSYILYIKPSDEKYTTFEIPKKSGGKRIIHAPCSDLKNLQKRLAKLLQDCTAEINEVKKINTVLSHGFQRKYSIITNANEHRNKRYVFNIDLENFFGTINFGRVRGFFIKNKNFLLAPKVATILAQISCHNNELPQGSPCSPVISNLIGHILDIDLAKLSRKTSCHYSRYADDLTFSTNKKNFPSELATQVDEQKKLWQPGKELNKAIKKNGFLIKSSKTRMQYKESRQDVTGLIVNSKVGIRSEYWRTVRAMTCTLFKVGRFYFKESHIDEKGNITFKEIEGKINQLNGMLSFIDSVDKFNELKSNKKIRLTHLNSREKTYKEFLFFINFYSPSLPLILCEGKTDNVYIECALSSIGNNFPQLFDKGKNKVKTYQYTDTSQRILSLGGGTGDLKNFIHTYADNFISYKATPEPNPVIILIDNDEGAKELFALIKSKTKASNKVDGSEDFYFLGNNLYVVVIPKKDNKDTMIEDYFEESILNREINGKKFSRRNEFDNKFEYGKSWFAEKIIKPSKKDINFEEFKLILAKIDTTISDYKNKASTS